MCKCKGCYIKLTLWIWCRTLSQHPLSPARHQPHPLTPSAQTIIQEETKSLEKRSNSQQIVLYCPGIHTQNPRLREVDLEPSSNRGSDKINRLRPRRKNITENKLYCTACTHKREPSTYRGRLITQC